MVRSYIISQLTQSTTWFGLIIMISCLFFPKSWVFVIGVIIMLTPDQKIQSFFAAAREEIEQWLA